MLYKFITLSICIIAFNSCSFYSQNTKNKLEGKYVLISGKSFYDSFNFKGKSTVVIESLGMEFVTSYIEDEEYLRIESEPSNLLLKLQSKDTIIGEGFAFGIYIKESLRKQDQAVKPKAQLFESTDIKQDTTHSNEDKQKLLQKTTKEKVTTQDIKDNTVIVEKKHMEQKRRNKEQAISNRVTGAFGIGGTEKNNHGDVKIDTGNQGSPFGNSEYKNNESADGHSSFSLNGRSLGVRGVPRPTCTILKEGKIVINITVDPKGNIIFAEIGRGTNIDNASMRKSALDAAKRAKFNSINGANNQSGTITYVYKLK